MSMPMALLASPAAASSAPPQLLGKTITLSWHAVGVSTSDAGRTVHFDHVNTRTLYVSSAGRLFARGDIYSAKNPSYAASGSLGPGEQKTDSEGRTKVDLHFEGRQLVGSRQFEQGAGRMIATFDSSFSNCSLSVIWGKLGGAAVRLKGLDGNMYEIQSVSAESPTCSIREGNAFADQ